MRSVYDGRAVPGTGKVDFDTLGSDVWLEQFWYGVHGLYWFAILTCVITAC